MEPTSGDRRSTASSSTKPGAQGPGQLAAQRRLSGLQSSGPIAPPPTSASLYVADRAVAAACSARGTQKAELMQYLTGHQGTVGRMLQSCTDECSSELGAAPGTGTGDSRGSTAQSLRAPGSYIRATGSSVVASTTAATKLSPRFHDEAADLRQSILAEGRARRATAAAVRSPCPPAPAGSSPSSRSSTCQLRAYPTGPPDMAPIGWDSQQQAGFSFSSMTAAAADCHTQQPGDSSGSSSSSSSSKGSGSDSGDADELPDSEDGQLFHNSRVRGWRQRASMLRRGRQLSLSPAASGLAPAARTSLSRRPSAAISAAAKRLSAANVKSNSPGARQSVARGAGFKRSLSTRSSGGLRLSLPSRHSGRCSTGQRPTGAQRLLNSGSTISSSRHSSSGSSTRRSSGSSSNVGPVRFAKRGPSIRPSGALGAAAPLRRYSRSSSSVVRRASVRASVHARSSVTAARQRSGSLTAASADTSSGSAGAAAASIKGLLQQRAARQRRSVAVSRLLSLGQGRQAGSSGSGSSLESSRRSSDSTTTNSSSSSDAQQRVRARAAAVSSRCFSQTSAQPHRSVAAAAAARRAAAAAAAAAVRPSDASGRYRAGSGFRLSASTASEDVWSTHSTTNSALTSSSGGGGYSNAGSSVSAASEARRSLTGALEAMLNPPRGKAPGHLSLSEHDAAAMVLGRRSSSGNGGDGQARALRKPGAAAGFNIPPPRHSRTLKRCGSSSNGSRQRGNGHGSIGAVGRRSGVAARASAVRPNRKTWVQVYDEAVAASATV